MSDQQASPIAFVGLGRMGLPMARRLRDAGHLVRGFDTSGPARDAARDAGLAVAESLAEAVESAGCVILMLPSSDVVESIVAAGLLGWLRPGAVLVDMGSSRPLSSRELAARAAKQDLAFVDAPVSGGVRGAEAGTLTIMAGGPEHDLLRIRPFLEVLGGTVVHAGGVGAGHALKAFNNLLSASHLLATSEAIVAGQRFGLSPRVMLQAINGSSGRSGSSEVKWPKFVLPATFDSGFALALMVKDMRIAVELAQSLDSPIGYGEATLRAWSQAAQALPATADHTEIARWIDTFSQGADA